MKKLEQPPSSRPFHWAWRLQQNPFESEDELCQFDDECLLISICLRSDFSFGWSCGRDFFSGQHILPFQTIYCWSEDSLRTSSCQKLGLKKSGQQEIASKYGDSVGNGVNVLLFLQKKSCTQGWKSACKVVEGSSGLKPSGRAKRIGEALVNGCGQFQPDSHGFKIFPFQDEYQIRRS